jgi:hypothetical protein
MKPVCEYRGDPVCFPPNCGGACPLNQVDMRPERREEGARMARGFIITQVTDDTIEGREVELCELKLTHGKDREAVEQVGTAQKWACRQCANVRTWT